MTDDDAGLSQTEAAQWKAIVSSEWPIESAILTRQLSGTSVPSDGASGASEELSVTVYQPRRPRLTPLTLGVMALAASAWLTLQGLNPTYQHALLAGIPRRERALEVHDLIVTSGLTTIALAVAVSCFGVWAVATARYLLRRSSCRFVGSQSTAATVNVRPPNPATAATWVLLLLSVSAVAAWWIPVLLEATQGSSSDAVEALRMAAVGATTWLAVFLLCASALTVWAARESRHRLRQSALSLAR